VSFWRRLQLGRDPNGEAALVSAAQKGDRRAFDALVRAHERLLRAFLVRRAGPQSADDVLQETWMAAWTSLPSFRGRSRFKAWLFQVALHKCADQRRVSVAAGAEPIDEDMADDNARRLNPYVSVEMKHLVGEALDRLPETHRTLLEMYYFAELTLPEIAIVLNRNLNTVKYQFYKAHDRIAASLSDFAPEKATAATAMPQYKHQ
jgi:RNA polymerase sigma-70 factor, ECF subfamily